MVSIDKAKLEDIYKQHNYEMLALFVKICQNIYCLVTVILMFKTLLDEFVLS